MYRLPRSLTLRQHPFLLRRPGVRIPRAQTRRKTTQALYGPDGEPLRTQTVRFKKPSLFTTRRLATIGIYVGVTYGYVRFMWRHMDIEIEVLEEEEAEQGDETTQKAEGEEGEEVEEEEDGPPFYADEENTFIPLTWSRKLPRSYYRGSDPEWQDFIKVAKDKSRHKKVQDELVQIVYLGSVNHPGIARQLGKDLKVGKYWLDISFPDGPPQEYERSGIEIGDGFIAWSQQRVSPEKQWRLMRALWPEATATSSWATLKVLGGIQWRRFKQSMGWEGVDPAAPEERFRALSEMMQSQQKEQQDSRSVGKTQTDPNGRPGEVASRTDAASTSQPSRPTPSADSSQSGRYPWLPSVPLPSSFLPSTDPDSPTNNTLPSASDSMTVPIAMHVFQSTLSKSWNPKKMEPPRGTFVVQGMVEVRGARGRMLFDVQSSYNPRAGKYVQVNAAVRNFKRWSQPPKGGP